jgi:uncharacterized membrane protein
MESKMITIPAAHLVSSDPTFYLFSYLAIFLFLLTLALSYHFLRKKDPYQRDKTLKILKVIFIIMIAFLGFLVISN